MTFAVVVAAVLAFRLPQLAGIALGEGVGGAGFTLRRVEITGAHRVSRLAIYNVAFDQDSMAMPLVDLAATRARLLRFGWIREARVSRRLPDTLVIDVIERQPVAIWQNNRQLSLIDADGVVLEPVRVDAMPDLPLVIGPDANRHIGDLGALLQAAPRLQAADRRRDLGRPAPLGHPLPERRDCSTLPEGDDEARRAIARFAHDGPAGSPARPRLRPDRHARSAADLCPHLARARRDRARPRRAPDPGQIAARPGAGRSDGAARSPPSRSATSSPRSTSARPRSAR